MCYHLELVDVCRASPSPKTSVRRLASVSDSMEGANGDGGELAGFNRTQYIRHTFPFSYPLIGIGTCFSVGVGGGVLTHDHERGKQKSSREKKIIVEKSV